MMPSRENVKTVAALHEQSGELRVVVATIGGGGGAGSGGSEALVSQTRTFKATEAEALSTFLLELQVQLLIRVVPAASTVARITALPDMTGQGSDQRGMVEALSLIAESELPATLPEFRRASGIINPGRGSGSRPVGLVTGWPQRDDDGNSWRRLWPEPQVGVAEIAALAALAQLVGGVERAMIADPSGGGAAVLCVTPTKVVARVARLSNSGEHEFTVAAELLLEETARGAELAEHAPARLSSNLVISPEPSGPRLGGAIRDRNWLAHYGLAFGAIALFADPSPTANSLVAFHQIEPTTRPPVLQRITSLLGTPARAAAIIAACVAILLALPLGVSFARVKMLEKQVTNESELIARNNAAEKELAFYKLLREKRWPMTKLLADIAGAAPVGVMIETVELGQAEGLTLRGKADSTDLVTTFRENLGKTKVFTQVATPSTSPSADGVQFQLTAKIPAGGAVFPAKPIDDFAAKTLSERLYGEAAHNTRSSSRSDRSAASGNSGGNTRANRPSNSGSSRNNGSSSSSRTDRTPAPSGSSSASSPSSKDAPVIPPALTDAQIAAMDATTAMLEFGKRRKASTQSGLDADTKRRLTEEAEKAQRRMTEARQQAPAAGGAK